VGITSQDWTDVVTVYTKYSRYLLGSADTHELDGRDQSWEWLTLAFSLVRQPDLPSWVPDFHQQDTTLSYNSKYALRWYDDFRDFLEVGESISHGASRKGHRGAVLGTRRNELICRGKMMDEVVVVYPEIPSPRAQSDARENEILHYWFRLARWEEELAEAVLSGHTPDGRFSRQPVDIDVYWNTLLGGTTYGRFTIESYQGYHASMARMNEIAAEYDVIGK